MVIFIKLRKYTDTEFPEIHLFATWFNIDKMGEEDQTIIMITYNELDLLTSVGQSGSVLQLVTNPSESMLTADPELSPSEQHSIIENDLNNMETSIIGVHVGNNKDKNYTTVFHENMFLDFILPTIERFHLKHGKGSKDNNYNKGYKEPMQRLMGKYTKKLDARKVQRDILD